MSDKSSSNGGIGCGGVVQIIFIVLKLLNVISWSWWWVMSPTILTLGIVVFFLAAAFIVAAIKSQ